MEIAELELVSEEELGSGGGGAGGGGAGGEGEREVAAGAAGSIITAEKVLSTACLMKESLLRQRRQQKSVNILHPSLKLICPEGADVRRIRGKVQRLADTTQEQEREQEDISVNNDQEKTPVLECIRHVSALTQTAEELTLKLLNEEYLIASGHAGKATDGTQTPQRHLHHTHPHFHQRPSVDTVLNRSRQQINKHSNAPAIDFSSFLDQYDLFKDLSRSLVDSGAEIRAALQSHQELQDKWEKRMKAKSALQTVSW